MLELTPLQIYNLTNPYILLGKELVKQVVVW